MSKPHAVGIDLGTTYSVVARLDENGKSHIVRNFHGDILTPSVVLFDDKEIIVGKDAKKAGATDPDRVADCVKRDMGSEFYSKPIRGEKLPPEVIQACILRKLAADAVRACGSNIRVVITVPAYFDEPRRKSTADAGEMAGLDVLDIVNEPTAAALSFGEHLGYLDPKGSPKGEIKVLVYDLGGGTFDVTVIELKPGNVKTLATDGDVRLGGRDWDQRVADYLAEKFQIQHGKDPRTEPASLARLLRAVEEAKHTLSARVSANVHLDHAGKSVDLTITRETFEELTEDLLERTAYTTRQVLQAAGTSWQYISHVLLVGGSTRMPMVSAMLERLSGGMKPEHAVNADEAVARGAAVYAGYLLATREASSDEIPSDAFKPVGSTFKVTDVNAHSLGIEGVDQETLRKENIILIPRNSQLPCKVQERFITRRAGQQSVAVQVLEGESKSPEQCTRIARAAIKNLPEGLPQGYPIEVSYEYGANGRLSVLAKLPGTTKEAKIELERERGLSNDRLARWKRVVTEEKGFDAFDNLLEEVLQIDGDEAPRKPAAAPISQPSSATPASKPSVGNSAMATAQPAAATKPTGAAAAAAAAATAMAVAEQAAKAEQPDFAARPLPTFAPSPARKGRSSTSMIVNIVGHLVSSVLGLSIGYYILCWIEPSANFLELNLPGIPAPAVAPANPTPQP